MELSPAIMQFAVFIPIIIAFYFLLIRPQQKRQKEQQAMLNGLQKNDRVITSGGLIGHITKVSEEELSIEVGENVEVNIIRSAVTQKLQSTTKSANRPRSVTTKQKSRNSQRKSSANKDKKIANTSN